MDFEWFKSLTDKGVFFVTRVRAKSVYKVLERKSIIPGQGITSDQIIQLNSAYAIKQNLKIKAFIGRSKNAILTQIWIAMIAYLLMSFARYSARKEPFFNVLTPMISEAFTDRENDGFTFFRFTFTVEFV